MTSRTILLIGISLVVLVALTGCGEDKYFYGEITGGWEPVSICFNGEVYIPQKKGDYACVRRLLLNCYPNNTTELPFPNCQ